MVANAYIARARTATDEENWESVADDAKRALDFQASQTGRDLRDNAIKKLGESNKPAPEGGNTSPVGQQ
jgi:hypothetical protein